MKRAMCSILALCLTGSALLTGCSSDSTTHTGDKKPWTVLMYLCGTDLESDGGAASANLEEIKSASFENNVNYIIETGGTQTWQTDGISSDTLQRFVVSDGQLEMVDEQESASMGESSTLGDYLKWGAKTYPAEKYMAVFWNHGGGSVSGVEFDQLYDNDSLDLNELSDGIAQAGINFEVLGFDTCLMSTLENASAISEYGKYMVASEEYEPGGGWSYDSWLNYLGKNPNCDGIELGKVICDSYYSKCENSGNAEMATLAVTDLSQTAQLQTAFNAMAAEMTGITEDISTFQSFAKAAYKAENYGGNTDEEGYTNMVDLGDLALKTKGTVSSSTESVVTAISSAVKYSVHGSNREHANGISVFFPIATTTDECDNYAKVCKSPNYLKFIEAVVSDWTAPSGSTDSANTDVNPVTKDDYKIEYKTYVDDNSLFNLDITNGIESVLAVKFSLYYMDEEAGEYLLLSLDDDIDADWDNGSFKDNFGGYQLTIDGNYCCPQLVSQEDTYNIYSVPVMLNGEQTNLRVIYDFDKKEYQIIGAYSGIDSASGMSSRDIVKLKDGDEVTLLFDAVNFESGETTTYQMGSFTVNGDVKIDTEELLDGDYLYQYQIESVFGDTIYTDSAIMTCKDGSIEVYETE